MRSKHDVLRLNGTVLCSWLISLIVIVLIVVLGDFGRPSWIFVLCGVWLCSVGLPTTVVLLAMAAMWQSVPGIGTPSLGVFAVLLVVLSLIAQSVFVRAAFRFWTRGRNS